MLSLVIFAFGFLLRQRLVCGDRIIHEEITFFDDCALDDVLKKARNLIEWNEKFNTIKDAKQKFLSMKVLK